jgi:hypothetical protein
MKPTPKRRQGAAVPEQPRELDSLGFGQLQCHPLGRAGASRHAFVVHLFVVQILGERPHERPGFVRLEITLSSARLGVRIVPCVSSRRSGRTVRPVDSATKTPERHTQRRWPPRPRPGTTRRAMRGRAGFVRDRSLDARRELRPEERRRFGHVGLRRSALATQVGRLRRARLRSCRRADAGPASSVPSSRSTNSDR